MACLDAKAGGFLVLAGISYNECNKTINHKTMADDTKKSPMITIVVGVVIIGLAIGAYFLFSGKDTTNTTNQPANTNETAVNTNTTVDPYADLKQYDGTTIDITSTDGKVVGQIGIKFDMTETYPISVIYFMKVNDSLPKSRAEVVAAGDAYYYITNHSAEANIRTGNGTGALSAAFCNTDQDPDVLAIAADRSISIELYEGCDAQYDPWHTTSTFYHLYGNYYDSDNFDYEMLTSRDTLAIFDSAAFYVEDTETGGYSADYETVISDGEITSQYSLIYTE
ncbi:hypothetical protein KJ705_03750 [Patescibacteria group bacterium]|nr:hypothetical protein [Patescibacteria group bacterium]